MALERTLLKMPKTQKFRDPKQRKYLITGGLIILIILAVAAAKLSPLSVGGLKIHSQEFTKGFTEEGEIVAAQEWPIFNPVEGKLQSLKVQNGDKVKKGQVLLEMSTSDLNYQLAALQAQYQGLEGERLQNHKNPDDAQVEQQKLIVQQAEKDAQTEEQNLARMKALYQTGSISTVEYEAAQASTEKAQNYLEQQKEGLQLIYEQYQASQGTEQYYVSQKKALQAQIDQLVDKISQAEVVALQDGTVKDLSLKEGSVVPLGQQIMTVYGNNGYKIESFVLASDAPDIKVGSPVQIIQNTSIGNKSFTGKVEALDPSAVERISPLGLKENRVKITIQLKTPSASVVLGSNVDVNFTTLEEPNKLLIPKTALFPYQQGDAVWVLQQGKAKIQPVKKGLENDRDVIIEQGLSEGDVVVLDPNIPNLKEGKRVKAVF